MSTSAITYVFDEVRLIPDPAWPDITIGYIDCIADISLDPYSDGWVIDALWCRNTNDDGWNVRLDRASPLYALLENSIRQQFGDRPLDALHEAEVA